MLMRLSIRYFFVSWLPMLIGFFLSDVMAKGSEYALSNLPQRAAINAVVALIFAGGFYLWKRRKRTFR